MFSQAYHFICNRPIGRDTFRIFGIKKLGLRMASYFWAFIFYKAICISSCTIEKEWWKETIYLWSLCTGWEFNLPRVFSCTILRSNCVSLSLHDSGIVNFHAFKFNRILSSGCMNNCVWMWFVCSCIFWLLYYSEAHLLAEDLYSKLGCN